jgi:type IV secretory pathway component VirB8
MNFYQANNHVNPKPPIADLRPDANAWADDLEKVQADSLARANGMNTFLMGLSAVCVIGAAAAVYGSKPEIAVITVDPAGGVAVSGKAAKRLEVTDTIRQAWIEEYARGMNELDPIRTEDNLARVMARSRGKAFEKAQAWITQNQPVRELALRPTLTQVIAINSVLAQQGKDSYIVRFTATRSELKRQTVSSSYLMTITVLQTEVDTKQSNWQLNPTGIVASDWGITEEDAVKK